MQDIVWFSEVDKNDVEMVGGKGANLGEMYRANIPIPNGFIVTSQAYFKAITTSGAADRIKGILYNLDADNPLQLEEKAKACQKEILEIELDSKLQKTLFDFYEKLGKGKNVYVAVRSSATAEDLPDASFAGQQSTFLNISGKEELKKAVLEAWASLFEARAIFYRRQKNYDDFKVKIAIPVQQMVQSDSSGIMFTLDPVTSNKKIVVIEAIFGLGELIVQGEETPDHYEVDKKSLKITAKKINAQKNQLVKVKSKDVLLKISRSHSKDQKITDEQIISLAQIGLTLEKHYFFPQDIEWAIEKGQIYIVQTRPVTTIKKEQKPQKIEETEKLKVLAVGSPASPAIASGKVVIVKNVSELNKVTKGTVLVTEMTNPDFVPAMKRAVAIVTEKGGRTSHAAIVSRELGIASAVGVEGALKKLKDGMVVTVDGSKGIIYLGSSIKQKAKITTAEKESQHVRQRRTATHLYVNLADPDQAPIVAAKNVDGVGLLRAEFLLAKIGQHPKEYIRQKKQHEFVQEFSKSLSVFAKAFGRRPIIYRASDFKSNEYRNLKGGDKYEPQEPNPLMGYRGAYRYIKDPDVFKMELDSLLEVRKIHQNVHLLIPFVRNPQELKTVRSIVEEKGLFNDPTFKFYMMAELPTNVLSLENFIDVGIDGISIGTNDLTMLVLGTDRDNEEVASEYYEMDPSVLWCLEKIVKTANKFNITSSICGEAPSVYPQLTEMLVSWGVTSISVDPDVVESTREIISEAEKKLVSRN